MKCLRCGAEMKHYRLNNVFNVYGKDYKMGYFSPVLSEPHNPHSIFECDECGYCELSTKICEEPDI